MNTNQKIFLISGLIMMFVVLLIGLIIDPMVKEIKEISFSVKEKNGELIALKGADQDYLEQLEVDYEKTKQDISLVKLSFLDPDKAVDLIVELESFASLSFNELEIKDVRYPAFTLRLTGAFSNLMKYVGWLENSRYFVNINSIKMKRIKEGETVETFLQISLPNESYEE
jgi:hypothetical protein